MTMKSGFLSRQYLLQSSCYTQDDNRDGEYLYIHLIIRGPMNRSIQTKSNYRDSSVNCEPVRKDPITK